MSHKITRLLTRTNFDDIDNRTRKALTANGFGMLTEIDVQKTMKAKPEVNMPAYRKLEPRNPKMAHQAIGIEPRVGGMPSCNVILREVEGDVEASALAPVASMQAIENAELTAVAGVRDLLAKAVEAI